MLPCMNHWTQALVTKTTTNTKSTNNFHCANILDARTRAIILGLRSIFRLICKFSFHLTMRTFKKENIYFASTNLKCKSQLFRTHRKHHVAASHIISFIISYALINLTWTVPQSAFLLQEGAWNGCGLFPLPILPSQFTPDRMTKWYTFILPYT